jgi:four helix bundle protein
MTDTGRKSVTSQKPYDIRERTFLFSVEVIKWVRRLPKDLGTQIAARQLVRSATSIGANVEEADGAETTKDRINKWAIARKEGREARYWVRVVCAANPHTADGMALDNECSELVKILSALINKGKTGI